MNIRPMRAVLTHADGTKLTATFHNFVNAPKMVGYETSTSLPHQIAPAGDSGDAVIISAYCQRWVSIELTTQERTISIWKHEKSEGSFLPNVPRFRRSNDFWKVPGFARLFLR
jgi:hypothetical protein